MGAEFQRYNINVAALQEVRWKKRGRIDKKNFSLLYSGGVEQGCQEMAFMGLGKIKEQILETKEINGRLNCIRFYSEPFRMSILNVYAPIETAKMEDKDKLYEVEKALRTISKEDMIIILEL